MTRLFQTHVPHVPSQTVRAGPSRRLHADDGLCAGGRQEVPLLVPQVSLAVPSTFPENRSPKTSGSIAGLQLARNFSL